VEHRPVSENNGKSHPGEMLLYLRAVPSRARDSRQQQAPLAIACPIPSATLRALFHVAEQKIPAFVAIANP
jgi:hypothetical protein